MEATTEVSMPLRAFMTFPLYFRCQNLSNFLNYSIQGGNLWGVGGPGRGASPICGSLRARRSKKVYASALAKRLFRAFFRLKRIGNKRVAACVLMDHTRVNYASSAFYGDSNTSRTLKTISFTRS